MASARSRAPATAILHADMDAFYASVEQRDDPTLRGRPVAVGGASARGVVAAASYEARRFGVRSAMPMVRARRMCPDLVVVAGRFDVYRDVSRAVMAVFRDFTPLVEPLSLDEAFLDVSGAVGLFGSPIEIAQQVRTRVREEVDLAVSIGVAPNKFLAKLCSGKAKPDGVLHLAPDQVTAFLRPLPVSDLWGAGPRTVERLDDFGLHTVADIADSDVGLLMRLLGKDRGRQLHQLAHGRDLRQVVAHEGAKSVSAETTFEVDVDDPEELQRVILRLATKVAARLRRAELSGRTVTLKVRFANFKTITRSQTVDIPTNATREIVAIAVDLLDRLRLERVRVRLVGVGVGNLADGDAAHQLVLDLDERWKHVDAVSDAVRDRFDGSDVTFASLLDDDDVELSETGDDRRLE
ncbi:MAG TPA: DNA polymerase IV [Nitriliruptoraceae bacterium]|nr:DNA polymerase IV [Nitriliruptoraceae bacterium]